MDVWLAVYREIQYWLAVWLDWLDIWLAVYREIQYFRNCGPLHLRKRQEAGEDEVCRRNCGCFHRPQPGAAFQRMRTEGRRTSAGKRMAAADAWGAAAWWRHAEPSWQVG